jgi:hypothetical protein
VCAEPLERIDLQRVSGVIALERDDGAQRTKFVIGHQIASRHIAGVERRLDFVEPATTVPGPIFDRPDSRVAAPPPVKALVGGTISDK